jgi:hypothetical protein
LLSVYYKASAVEEDKVVAIEKEKPQKKEKPEKRWLHRQNKHSYNQKAAALRLIFGELD